MKKIVLLLSMGMLLFSCRPPENPSVITGEVTDITGTTAICAGDVTADGGAAIIARGVCWSTSQFPSISDSKTSNGNGLGGFTSNITGLSPGTTYYVRAYATNAAGTAYGEQNKFTTLLERPTVVTGDVTNIAATTADCSGNVTADGGVFVIDRGVCWSTDSYPLIGFDPQTTDGTGLGTYTSNITGLSPNTTYYVSAYATNFKGTGYGVIKTFTTDIGMPTVVTGDVTNRTATTADCSGNVTADGGAAVTARGVCWRTSENPSTSDSKTTDGTGVGTYTSNITGLSLNTTYYVRAYATNSVGTAYGEQRTFKTQEINPVFGSFTDSRDGNQYVTVTLGKQVWMAENLAYLTSVSKPYSGSWSSPYCYVYGYVGTSVTTAKATTNYQTYGVLYNWPAALEACPDGWHLPSDGEWTTLTDYLGGIFVATDKLKEAGTTHWPSPNDATNESGFTALPGGYRFDYDSGANFEGIGYQCYWWSSTEINASNAWYRTLKYHYGYVYRGDDGKKFGFSVRCVRD